MTLDWPDRRAYPRYSRAAALMFTFAGQLYSGNIHDLGKGGLSYWAEVDLPVGESLTLALTLMVGTAQAKVTNRATIRWKQTPQSGLFRYGAAFGPLNPAQLEVLAEFLGGTSEPPVRNPG